MLKIWDFLIASNPCMIIFLCAAILLVEWSETGFTGDNMMECIQELKDLKFEKKLDVYFKKALELHQEVIRDKKLVEEFNGLLLEGYTLFITILVFLVKNYRLTKF